MKQKILLLLSLFVIAASQAWGQTYDLVTSNAQLEEGAEYIIAGTTLNNNFWIVSTTQNNNNRAAIQNGTATSMPATLEFATGYASFVLGVSGEKWTLYDANPAGTGTTNGGTSNGVGGNVGYLYPVNNNNYLRTQASAHEWTISVNNTTSVATIQTTVENRAIKLNASGGLFSAYKSGQRDIYLYKKGVASTDPILNTSETEITGLGYMEGNAPVSQSFSLSGMNLEPTSGNITVTAPANFQVSTDDISFSNSLNISYSGGTLASTDVYVRLNESLAINTYTGNITISGGGASDAIVSVEGMVTAFSTECGFEDFTNATGLPTGSNYDAGTYTNNGITWNFHGQSPLEAGQNGNEDYSINGQGILLRRASDSFLEATIPAGVGTFSFEYRKAYTGSSARQLELIVDGEQVATTAVFGNSSGADATVYTFTHTVNVEGEVTIRIKLTGSATTNRHVTIDNITWTCSDAAPADTHFRSQADGNWTSASTWESSEDGISWSDASIYPNENAESVEVRTGHTVTIDSSDAVITKTSVYGTLEVTTADAYSVEGEQNGIELTIEDGGVFLVNSTGSFAIPAGNAFGLVKTGGKIVAGPSMTNGVAFVNAYVGYTSGIFYFGDASICEWANTNTTLGSSSPLDYDFFRPYEEGDMPIFRISATPNGSFGNGSNDNIFNCILEIIHPAEFKVALGSNSSPQRTKTFVGGVRGSGKLIMENNNGPLIIGGNGTDVDVLENIVPELGGTATIVTNGTNDRLRFPNGATVSSGASFTIENNAGETKSFQRSGGTFNINGILDITNQSITNADTGGISVNNGGTIRTRHTGGLFGLGSAIPSNTDNLTLNEDSTVEYYADVNQTISTGKEYYHLKLSGAATKTPGNATNVHTNGSVSISGTTTLDYTSYNLASTSSNSTAFNMDGGRLILGTTGTQPNMQGTYTISGGTVEFVNNGVTDQTIRGGSSIQYFQIEVSGSNVKNSTGNIWIKNGGDFIVNSGGIFEISGSNSIRCQTSGQCGVLIDDNAVFRVGNGDGFYGTNSAAIALDISEDDILLGEDSVIEFFRTTGNQKLSPFTPGYENVKVSGNAVTMEANVEIHNNLELTAAADLTVLSTSDENPPIVLTVNGGIDVATGGQLTFQNNAQLMQDEDAVNSGEMTMHRLFTLSEGRQQYNFITSPVSGQTIKTIYPDAPFVIKLNEPTNWFLDAGVGDYIPGKAYGIKEPTAAVEGSTVTGIMSGGFVNGLVEFELSRTPDAGGEEYGSNLVGNPYPSALDLDLFYIENGDNIGSTFWLWDNRGNIIYEQQGSGYTDSNYATYNASTSTGVAASGASGTLRTPNEYIKPGTGFIVDAETGADGENLVFTNEMRTTETGPGFFGKASVTKDRYWLNLKTPAGLNIQTAVVYFPGGNNELWLDDSDARYGSDDLYSLVNDNQLSIQGKAPFEQRDRVPLGVRLFNTGVYVLSVDKTEGIFEEGQTIYLRDRQTKTIYNLSERPYKFVGYAGEFNNRFEILYRKTTLDELSAVAIGGRISIDKINHQIAVSSTLDKIEKVEVFNLSGRLIYEKSNINRLNYEIPVEEFSKQIIIVRTTSEKGEIVSKKFVNK